MRNVLIVFFVLIIAGYASCSFLFPVYSIRFRLTSTIRSDGVDHQASGVIECSYRILPDSLGSAGSGVFGGEMHGYAITADMGHKEFLYFINANPMLANRSGTALYPRGEGYCALPLVAFGFQGYGLPSVMQQILKRFPSSGTAEVSNGKLPAIIRFATPGDLGSAEEIDPNDLPAILGPGARIVKTTVEVTRESISPRPIIWPEWLTKAPFTNVPLNGHLAMPRQISNHMFEGE